MSEKELAKKDGARLQKNSGRGQYSKGDARWPADNPKYTIDYKEVGKSFTVNEKVWAKVCADAFKNGDEPVIQIVIGGKVRLALVDWNMLEELEDERA